MNVLVRGVVSSTLMEAWTVPTCTTAFLDPRHGPEVSLETLRTVRTAHAMQRVKPACVSTALLTHSRLALWQAHGCGTAAVGGPHAIAQ
jgi:ribosomal protein L37AE/L43A